MQFKNQHNYLIHSSLAVINILIIYQLPPLSRTKYLVPNLLKSQIPPNFSLGNCRQYKDAHSGSKAIDKFLQGIPAYELDYSYEIMMFIMFQYVYYLDVQDNTSKCKMHRI